MSRNALLCFTLIAMLLPCWAASGGASPPPLALQHAFSLDAFRIVKCLYAPKGGFGCLAAANNATTLSTNLPKPSIYINATHSSDVGWLFGALCNSEQADLLATSFLDRIVVDLIDAKFAEKHWNTTLYKEVFSFISWLLTSETIRVFDEQVQAGGVFPSSVLHEMDGFLAGLHHSAPNTRVTRETVISLNYAFDVFSVHVFGDPLRLLEATRPYAELHRFLARVPQNQWPFVPVAACDALGLKGSFTRDGAPYFGRALQFKTADILQDTIVVLIIDRPGTSFIPTTSVTVPGIVGSFTGINARGVAMGFDTTRAANVDANRVGLNSMLLTRVILETCGTAYEAVDAIAGAPRGCPYLYPLCDATGECAVLEAGAYVPPGRDEDPLQYVNPLLKLEGLVPDRKYLRNHPTTTFDRGLWVRWSNYTDEESHMMDYVHSFNPNLFRHAKVPYDPTTMELLHPLFKSWQENDQLEGKLKDNFFFPQKEKDPDLIAVSNIALVPQARLPMMGIIDDFVARTGESIVWRYESLLNMSYAFKGDIDFDRFTWIMLWLSPDRTPGYWDNYLIPNKPMSAVIEGVWSVFDLQARHQVVHSGYWIDNMVDIHLLNYINVSNSAGI